MRYVKLITLLGLGFFLGAGPQTQPARNFEDVESLYQNRASTTQSIYEHQMQLANTDRIVGLQLLLNRAMHNGDLDEANRMKERLDLARIDAVTIIPSAAQKSRLILESRLAGTKWHEPNPQVIWTLDGDGSCSTSDNRSATWAAINANTIILTLTDGNTDRWQFNDDLSSIHDVNARLGSDWTAGRAE